MEALQRERGKASPRLKNGVKYFKRYLPREPKERETELLRKLQEEIKQRGRDNHRVNTGRMGEIH